MPALSEAVFATTTHPTPIVVVQSVDALAGRNKLTVAPAIAPVVPVPELTIEPVTVPVEGVAVTEKGCVMGPVAGITVRPETASNETAPVATPPVVVAPTKRS